MSAQSQHESSAVFDFNPAITDPQFQALQHRIETLETQLERAIRHSMKKEAYANTLATDLEHIISQLQRLEVIK